MRQGYLTTEDTEGTEGIYRRFGVWDRLSLSGNDVLSTGRAGTGYGRRDWRRRVALGTAGESPALLGGGGAR